MTTVSIPGNKGTVEFRDGVLYLRWIPGAAVEESDARAAMAAADRLRPGPRHPMLVDVALTESAGQSARAICSIPSPAARIAHLGSPVDRVIINFSLSRRVSACPTRFFTSLKEATSWLNNPRRD
jgi:hypothetical protein